MIMERHIIKDYLDHLLLLFELVESKHRSKNQLFRFEHMWLSHESCKLVVEDSWGDEPCLSMTDASAKIKTCSEALAV